MAIICDLTRGYSLECASVGGIQKIYLTNWTSNINYVVDNTPGSPTENMVQSVVLNPAATQSTLFLIEQRPEYAEFTQDGQFSDNGTTAYETKLSIRFIHLDNELRNLLNEVGRAPLVAIIQSLAGDWYLAGLELAGYAGESKSGTGKVLTDLNGADLTIIWKSPNGAFLIDEDPTTGLFGTNPGQIDLTATPILFPNP